VATVNQIRDSDASARLGATAPDGTPATDRDRRAADANLGGGGGQIDLARSAIGQIRYPPWAVTILLVIESAVVFGVGRAMELYAGVATTDAVFGPHGPILLAAGLLYPVATVFQNSFEHRATSIASMWGMRLIAPLAVALLVAIAFYAALFPSRPLAPSEAALLRWVGSWCIAAYLANGLLGSGFEKLIRYWEGAGRLARHVAVFGGGTHGQRFIEALASQPVGSIRIEAFFDDRSKKVPDEIAGVRYGGTADDLALHVQRERIDEIFIALPWSADNRILDLLRRFRHLPMPVRLAPDVAILRTALEGAEAAEIPLTPIIREQPLSAWGLFVKGTVDRIVATLALLWLSPLLAAIALLVKLESPGPVFFLQPRLGFNNRPFSVYKFRTMRMARSADQTLRQASKGDPRVTRIGGFLRRWSIDELPQLLNVIAGTMSLVGPRPHPIWRQAGDLWEQGGNQPLEAIIHEYAARHRVKPGITGWAQISGYRGETATVERMLKRVELDLYYIDNWSLWFDIKILLRTFLALFKSDGAF
jgi:polysaccharide biosynthesis protein PslA